MDQGRPSSQTDLNKDSIIIVDSGKMCQKIPIGNNQIKTDEIVKEPNLISTENYRNKLKNVNEIFCIASVDSPVASVSFTKTPKSNALTSTNSKMSLKTPSINTLWNIRNDISGESFVTCVFSSEGNPEFCPNATEKRNKENNIEKIFIDIAEYETYLKTLGSAYSRFQTFLKEIVSRIESTVISSIASEIQTISNEIKVIMKNEGISDESVSVRAKLLDDASTNMDQGETRQTLFKISISNNLQHLQSCKIQALESLQRRLCSITHNLESHESFKDLISQVNEMLANEKCAFEESEMLKLVHDTQVGTNDSFLKSGEKIEIRKKAQNEYGDGAYLYQKKSDVLVSKNEIGSIGVKINNFYNFTQTEELHMHKTVETMSSSKNLKISDGKQHKNAAVYYNQINENVATNTQLINNESDINGYSSEMFLKGTSYSGLEAEKNNSYLFSKVNTVSDNEKNSIPEHYSSNNSNKDEQDKRRNSIVNEIKNKFELKKNTFKGDSGKIINTRNKNNGEIIGSPELYTKPHCKHKPVLQLPKSEIILHQMKPGIHLVDLNNTQLHMENISDEKNILKDKVNEAKSKKNKNNAGILIRSFKNIQTTDIDNSNTLLPQTLIDPDVATPKIKKLDFKIKIPVTDSHISARKCKEAVPILDNKGHMMKNKKQPLSKMYRIIMYVLRFIFQNACVVGTASLFVGIIYLIFYLGILLKTYYSR